MSSNWAVFMALQLLVLLPKALFFYDEYIQLSYRRYQVTWTGINLLMSRHGNYALV
jgi:hypothetical protein